MREFSEAGSCSGGSVCWLHSHLLSCSLIRNPCHSEEMPETADATFLCLSKQCVCVSLEHFETTPE